MAKTMKTWQALLLGGALAVAGTSRAASQLVDGLWQFVAGDPMRATELNENFEALRRRIVTLETTRRGGFQFCGVTAAVPADLFTQVPGAANGYAAAATLCRSVMGCSATGARMCTPVELVDYATSGAGAPPGATTDRMWYSLGHSNNGSLNDCSGWSVTTGMGPAWFYAGVPLHQPTEARCQDAHPVACCEPR